jgi:hypothetical protein
LRLDRSSRAGIVAGLGLLVVLILHNRDLLFTAIWEDGDFAANSILIDKARDFELLVGNYSRFGFNHPGPALLYVQAWSQLLFRDAVGVFASPFGAQFFGILVLNAILCGLCVAIVVRRTGLVLAAPVFLACALLSAWLTPGLLDSTWMPDVYLCPFLLLLVSAASVATLALRDAWKLVLAAGVLVHGNVSFILFTVGVGAAVALALWLQRASLSMTTARRPLRQSVAIALVFALPPAVNTAVNYPGEFPAYWHYSRSHQAGGHGVRAALAFVGDYWAGGRAGHVLGLFIVIAAALAAWTFRGSGRPFLIAVVGCVLVTTVLAVVYAMFGIDDLSLRYIALFYNAAPILTFFTVGISVGNLASSRPARLAIAGAAALALGFLASRPALENPYRGASWIPAGFDSVNRLGPTRIRLDFDLPYWPEAAGLVEESRRLGHRICVVPLAPIYRTIFTTDLICPPAGRSTEQTVEIESPPRSSRGVLYRGPGFALVAERPA